MRGRREQELLGGGQPVSLLGVTVRAWRRYRNLSITELAIRAGFGKNGRAYISKVEHGQIQRLHATHLGQIAHALQVSDFDLLQYRLPLESNVDAIPSLSSSEFGEKESSQWQKTQEDHTPTDQILEALEASHEQYVKALKTEIRSLRAELQLLRQIQRLYATHLVPFPPGGKSGQAPTQQEAVELTPTSRQESNSDLPTQEQAFKDPEAIGEIAHRLVVAASLSASEIFVTFQGEHAVFGDLWRKLMQQALKGGCKVTHLIRLDNEEPQGLTPRGLTIVRDMLEFLPWENYSPFKVEDTSPDYLIVPKKGILEIVKPRHVIFHPQGEAVDKFYADLREKQGSASLLIPCPSPDIFDDAVMDSEKYTGNRFLVKSGPSAVASTHRRLEAFKHQLEQHEHDFQDIYLQSAIEEIAKGEDHPKQKELIKWLRFVLKLFEHPNYKLGLLVLDKRENATPLNIESVVRRISWLVKEKHSVLLQVSSPNDDGSKRDIKIEDPRLVKAFCQYSRHLWEHELSFLSKNKEDVQQWLHKQLAQASRRLAQRPCDSL